MAHLVVYTNAEMANFIDEYIEDHPQVNQELSTDEVNGICNGLIRTLDPKYKYGVYHSWSWAQRHIQRCSFHQKVPNKLTDQCCITRKLPPEIGQRQQQAWILDVNEIAKYTEVTSGPIKHKPKDLAIVKMNAFLGTELMSKFPTL